MKYLYILTLLFIFFNGCANTTQSVKKTVPKQKHIPQWISNPNYGGNVGIVSIVSKKKTKDRKIW